MKTSDKPTAHLLVKAGTNSQWDTCEFAIVYLSQQWKKEQAQRLESIQPFKNDFNLLGVHYYDTDVNFHLTDAEGQPDLEHLLAGLDMAFVELDDEDIFLNPENSLDCYRLIIHTDGTARYMAYGKHTGEEFFTENFSLIQLLKEL